MKNPLLSVALAGLIILAFGGDKAIASAAFSLAGIIKQAEIIKVNAVTAASNTAITVSTTIRGFAANDPYQIKNITVPKNTFMTRFKAGFGESGGFKGLFKRNAWYAAWAASIAAAGWAIDELTEQVTQTIPPPIANYYPSTMVLTSCSVHDSGGGAFVSYSNKTIGQCTANFSNIKNIIITGSFTLTGGNYSAPMTYQVNSNTGNGFIRVPSNNIPIAYPSTTSPVPDEPLFNSLVSFMLQDPEKAAQAFMVPDPWPYPYPQVLPDTTPYIPGVSQSDQELLDLYAQGLLQSTNPNAAHYVSPEKYAEIAALAGQLQQGATPEAQAATANEQLKKPLTQKELEESLKKEREAEEKAVKESLGEQPVLDTLLDPYKQFQDGVKNTPNDQIHALPSNNFIVGGNGQCYVITKTIGIMGRTFSFSTQGICEEFYYPYFLPILTWFFYVSTGIYVWFSLRDAFARRV